MFPAKYQSLVKNRTPANFNADVLIEHSIDPSFKQQINLDSNDTATFRSESNGLLFEPRAEEFDRGDLR